MKKTSFYGGLIALFVSWGAYFMYLWPKMLFWTDSGVSAGWIGIYGDWAAHFAYAAPFAYRPVTEWLSAHPLYYARKFTYPFTADALSGLLIRFNLDPVASFIIPSLLLSLLLLVALYVFFYDYLKSARQSLAAITIFFAGGGLGFWWFIQDLIKSPTLATLDFPPREYTHLQDVGMEWINVIVGQFLTQRALLLGVPLTLLMLIIIRRWWHADFKNASYLKVCALGLVSSLMLTIHIHSYMVFAIICAVFLATDLFSKRVQWRQWLVFGVSAAIPSLLIYNALYGGQLDSHFFSYYPGWLANKQAHDMNWLAFWLINWGLFLPLSLFTIWKTKYYKDPVIIGAGIVFILTNLMLFQPFPWDNTKLLTWVYIIFSIPISQWLGSLWQRQLGHRIAVVCLIVVLTASGFIDLWRVTRTDRLENQLWSNEDFAIAAQFRDISRPTDRVLASDQHNHWVSTQTGRQVLLGFRGWMWTYGINYSTVERDMRTMFAGGPEAERLFEQYDLSFVVIGGSELGDWQANESYFQSNHYLELQNHIYRVYRLKRADTLDQQRTKDLF